MEMSGRLYLGAPSDRSAAAATLGASAWLASSDEELATSQFPSCRAAAASDACGAACAASADAAMASCGAWADVVAGSSADTAMQACAKSIHDARGACSADGEAARCVDPVARGFHEMGVPDLSTSQPAATSTAAAGVSRSLLADWHAAELTPLPRYGFHQSSW